MVNVEMGMFDSDEYLDGEAVVVREVRREQVSQG